MELSAAEFEEAFWYSARQNFTGAIYEYCQRVNATPSIAVISGPVGAERLHTVELFVKKNHTIGIARTIKAARHRASEKMLRLLGLYAYSFVKDFEIK